MTIDPILLLIAAPLVFALGWLASRLDLKQLRLEGQRAPKAYFKGLNHLLNEQQDQAIDAFIEAVRDDPDTSELHFALGNLFRRRGEYQRAVRVHEHLLARGDLSEADRQRARHALALDFLKAGLLDRAEEAFAALDGSPLQAQARLGRLAIYERTREWARAAAMAESLEGTGLGSFQTRRAHHTCELAAEALAEGRTADAHRLLSEAQRIAPQAARPRLDQIQLLLREGRPTEAWKALLDLFRRVPSAAPLAAQAAVAAARGCGQVPEAAERLRALYQAHPSIDLLEALVALNQDVLGDEARARQAYVEHLEHTPSLIAASRWIAGEKLEHEQCHPLVQRALDQAVRPLERYRCAACGFEAREHHWHCPGCQAWDSYPPRRVEEL